jgi:hypothetical protein
MSLPKITERSVALNLNFSIYKVRIVRKDDLIGDLPLLTVTFNPKSFGSTNDLYTDKVNTIEAIVRKNTIFLEPKCLLG